MVLPLLCSSGVKSSTRPITTGPWTSVPTSSTASTSRPARTRASESCRPVSVRGQGCVLTQPGDRRLHRAVPTRERLKRTSPSTMSRMSSALFRNINVRSTPMPKAKPE